MIVVDENITSNRLIASITAWYPGQVLSIVDLCPATVVKDDGIATLLHKVNKPTFITTNVDDFWQVFHANKSYCIIGFVLTNDQRHRSSSMLRSLVNLPQFRTKAARMGNIIRVRQSSLEYYTIDRQIHRLPWPP